VWIVDEIEGYSISEALQLQHVQFQLWQRVKCLNYGRNKIVQSAEIFDLAWWCKQDKEFLDITKVACFIHTTLASSTASERSFSTAGCVMQD